MSLRPEVIESLKHSGVTEMPPTLISHFRKMDTAELRRLRSIMPSPDPDQQRVDVEENIPAIETVLKEREQAMPQVYVSISGGVGDVHTTRGEVDVVFIDWDNVTGDSWNGEERLLDDIAAAVDGSLRLPADIALRNLGDIEEYLDNFITGYEIRDAFRKRAVELLKRVRSDATDLEMQ